MSAHAEIPSPNESPTVPAPPVGIRERLRARAARRPVVSQEGLTLLVSLYLSIACNLSLWRAFVASVDVGSPRGALTAFCFFAAITMLHWALLTALQTRWTAKALLTLVVLISAAAAYYMGNYTVYMDPDMLRNVLHTEPKESVELLTAGFWLHMVLYAGLPAALIWRVGIERVSWKRAALRRAAALFVALLVAIVAGGIAFQDLAPLMRNHKDMRYLITPGNVVASLVAVLADNVSTRGQPREKIAEDARVASVPGARPKLLVIVAGETVRAQNWGLNGYRRQTTPELARLDVINFSDVTACGSSTEVSLPCMFSQLGRRDYDAGRIKRSESLLHVLERAGVATLWRDNQTGCKGVCEGLRFESFLHANDPDWCDGERCLDEVMLDGLFFGLDPAAGDRVIVLHQLGNHGPAYFSRYPADLRRFTPTCETSQLGDCTRDQIVNSYDNAILYTDRFLAKTISLLEAEEHYETAMIYVSDHGESLGESGLYLHGIPYTIAPDVQTKVPLVLWFSRRWEVGRGLDRNCLKAGAGKPVSHDNLFSTVLGMLQVRTRAYDRDMDLLADCSAQVPVAGLETSLPPGAK